ncbi:MAG TPA: cupin domain-containing protein [Micromonosporaceae bacterium]|nr:cupin domain-containing protein [Micromonosporaceae bacterium]
MRIITGAGHDAPPGYTEHLRVPDLSFGTYRLPAGGVDEQSPHTEDEVYVCTAGHARVVTPTGDADVGPGSVVFVPAGEEHRFVDITEDLVLLVFFGPAEYARAAS